MSAQRGVPMPTPPHPEAPGGSEARDWCIRAACRGMGDLFYTDSNTRGIKAQQQIAAAQRICFTCPVIQECDDYANANDEVWGVWAAVDRTPKADRERCWQKLALRRRA